MAGRGRTFRRIGSLLLVTVTDLLLVKAFRGTCLALPLAAGCHTGRIVFCGSKFVDVGSNSRRRPVATGILINRGRFHHASPLSAAASVVWRPSRGDAIKREPLSSLPPGAEGAQGNVAAGRAAYKAVKPIPVGPLRTS